MDNSEKWGMDYSEKWGENVNEAVRLALLDLKVPIEEVNVIVLEEPSRGFLLFGKKLAKVRVEKKKIEIKAAKETKETKEIPKKSKEAPTVVKPAQKEAQKATVKAPRKAQTEEPAEAPPTVVKQAPVATKAAPVAVKQAPIKEKQEKKAERQPEKKVEKPQEKQQEKPPEKVEKKESGKQKKIDYAKIDKPENLVKTDDHPVLKFIEEVAEKMELTIEIRAAHNEDCVYIDIEGKDAGTIIGKRGQTLDSVQYLAGLVANKNKTKYIRVVVDAEGYRKKRKETLELLADRLAGKVARTKKSVRLEPMNPYERKIIHSKLQSNAKVLTRSEGEEPNRRVVIEMK